MNSFSEMLKKVTRIWQEGGRGERKVKMQDGSG